MCIICEFLILLSLIYENDRIPINLLNSKEDDIDEIIIQIIKIKLKRENKFIINTSKL